MSIKNFLSFLCSDNLSWAKADIVYKLNHDWVAHKEAIYLPVHGAKYWNEAKDHCEKEKVKLVDVENESEEVSRVPFVA